MPVKALGPIPKSGALPATYYREYKTDEGEFQKWLLQCWIDCPKTWKDAFESDWKRTEFGPKIAKSQLVTCVALALCRGKATQKGLMHLQNAIEGRELWSDRNHSHHDPRWQTHKEHENLLKCLRDVLKSACEQAQKAGPVDIARECNDACESSRSLNVQLAAAKQQVTSTQNTVKDLRSQLDKATTDSESSRNSYEDRLQDAANLKDAAGKAAALARTEVASHKRALDAEKKQHQNKIASLDAQLRKTEEARGKAEADLHYLRQQKESSERDLQGNFQIAQQDTMVARNDAARYMQELETLQAEHGPTRDTHLAKETTSLEVTSISNIDQIRGLIQSVFDLHELCDLTRGKVRSAVQYATHAQLVLAEELLLDLTEVPSGHGLYGHVLQPSIDDSARELINITRSHLRALYHLNISGGLWCQPTRETARAELKTTKYLLLGLSADHAELQGHSSTGDSRSVQEIASEESFTWLKSTFPKLKKWWTGA